MARRPGRTLALVAGALILIALFVSGAIPGFDWRGDDDTTLSEISEENESSTSSPSTSTTAEVEEPEDEIAEATLFEVGPGQCVPGRGFIDELRAQSGGTERHGNADSLRFSQEELDSLQVQWERWIMLNRDIPCISGEKGMNAAVLTRSGVDLFTLMSEDMLVYEQVPERTLINNTYFHPETGAVTPWRQEWVPAGELLVYFEVDGEKFVLSKFACGNIISFPDKPGGPPEQAAPPETTTTINTPVTTATTTPTTAPPPTVTQPPTTPSTTPETSVPKPREAREGNQTSSAPPTTTRATTTSPSSPPTTAPAPPTTVAPPAVIQTPSPGSGATDNGEVVGRVCSRGDIACTA